MKALLILILTSFLSLQMFATPQIPDQLIYNGDTFFVCLSLPKEFYKPDTVMIGQYESIYTVDLFAGKKTCRTTACGKEYQATWEIIDNQLYLTGIYSCCYYTDSIKADLVLLFKEKVRDGKVKADWVTTNIFSQGGKRIMYIDAYLSIYEKDFEFKFNKGKLLYIKSYDNSKSKESIYSQDIEKLKQYIYSNIQWSILPKQDSVVVVFIEFTANKKGIIDDVKVKGYNNTYNQEAIRVIKSIPEWGIYLSRGKSLRIPWRILIIFSNENKQKYKK